MKLEDMIVGNYYITRSEAVFEFMGINENGDIKMKSYKNCMKIQQGNVVFHYMFYNDITPWFEKDS